MKNIGLIMATLPMLIAGCGGGGGALSAAGGSVTSTQAQAIFADNAIKEVLQTLEVKDSMTSPPISDKVGGGFFDDPFESCTTNNKDTAVDEDGDGIKKKLRYDFNCPNVTNTYGKMSRVGFYEVVDHKDENAPENKGWGGGYRYSYDFESSVDIANHEKFVYGDKGYFDVTNTGSSLIYDSKYKAYTDGQYEGKGQKYKWSWHWQSDWKNTYTPDDMANFNKAGNVQIGGFFKVSGTLQPDGQGVSTDANVVFEVRSKDLRYDRTTCPSQFWSEGEMSFKDGSGNIYKFVYSCGPAKTYYNGKEIVP